MANKCVCVINKKIDLAEKYGKNETNKNVRFECGCYSMLQWVKICTSERAYCAVEVFFSMYNVHICYVQEKKIYSSFFIIFVVVKIYI